MKTMKENIADLANDIKTLCEAARDLGVAPTLCSTLIEKAEAIEEALELGDPEG